MTGASLLPVMLMVTFWVSVPPLPSSTVMVKDDRDRLANGEEIQIGIGDGVIPVDRAVVGVTTRGAEIVKAFSIAACCAGVRVKAVVTDWT